VTNFEYAPREDYDCGEFKVFNEENERALLVKFFSHIVETKPTIFTTYNGDNFDWPFIQARADVHKIKMEDQIGIFNNI
jgi:DNA polymerase epsilon subunit 1